MNEPEKKRGLAALTPERRREIAQMGGKSVPREKRAFFKNPEIAKSAGSLGGQRASPEKRYFSLHPDKAQQAGLKSAQKRRALSKLNNKDSNG